MNPYSTFCDDFGLFVYLHTKVDLPTSSETVLHFFDTVQKTFPELTEFERRESGEYVLEEDRDRDSVRSVALDTRRLVSAFNNPTTLEEADVQHERILDLAPYHLDLAAINCDSLEVVFSFDFIYQGNHDEVIAEALAANTPFEPFMQHPGARVLHFEPSMAIALDEKCRLQARLWIESRTNTFQVQSGNYPEAPIAAYLMVNQVWGKTAPATFAESYHHQRKLAQEFVDAYMIPNVLRPLHLAISSR
jgi:hypothetical protein